MFTAKRCATVLLFSLSAAASAAPVTLQSHYTYTAPGAGPSVWKPAVFTLTYEDSAPIFSGSLASHVAQYKNAITGASISWDRPTLHLDTSVDNYVTIRSTGVTRGLITLSLLDDNGVGYELGFGFEPHQLPPDNVDLSGLIGLLNEDVQPHYILPEGCSVFYQCGYAFDQQDPLTQVPVPAAGWLLGSGLLVLGRGMVGRNRKG